MLVFPNAKINLGLRVIAKRFDGFHNIETVFYPVGLCDALEAIPASDGVFEFTSSGLPVPGNPADNLCVRACQLLNPSIAKALTENALPGFIPIGPSSGLPPVKVHLHKVIPIGSGLGGGSSDGAWMLKLLNDLFVLGLTSRQLQDNARQLGSDCAFFIENKPVLACEKGDRFLPLGSGLPDLHVALVIPDIHCNTTDAYAAIVPARPLVSIARAIGFPVEKWKNDLINDFEAPVFRSYPEIEMIKEKLYKAGAVYASLTGSGAAVFGIFSKIPNLENLFPGCFTWSHR
ncbi:MAG: 4-(cytidine 5'-diphospho)-2-C-methyl-D-erythritol kinase [Bacteroidales bacterium]|nr:4-(cytidine 5'-diphospho)-2-C-methyl-D-erythritol kinase [Bacteroidales bacterium]